jgi:hypothetical protein
LYFSFFVWGPKNGLQQVSDGGSPSFFVFAWLPLPVSVFASSSVSHGADAVIDDGENGGSWRWLWWWLCERWFSSLYKGVSLCFFSTGRSSLLQKMPIPKIYLWFPQNSSPKLLVPALVFISREGEDHLTPAMTQGKVGDGSCWQGMVAEAWFPGFLHHGSMGL